MHILFLTDTFPPENNAGALRTHDHISEWIKQGHQVTVLTAAPNFPDGKVYAGYRNRLLLREVMESIQVWRIWTYISPNQGTSRRMLDFVSYMFSASLFGLFIRKVDVVVATSPQMLVPAAGWLLAAIKRRPFVLEVRDLWPEQIISVGISDGKGLVFNFLQRLADFLYRRATLIVLVTEAYRKKLLEKGVFADKLRVITNGVHFSRMKFQQSSQEIRRKYDLPDDAFLAGYVGTIGLSQRLRTILETAAILIDSRSIHFVIMGGGAEKEQLSKAVDEEGLTNITFIERQTHQEAMDVLHALDVSLVLLADTPLFRTVIPTKIFEAMAMHRPVILGASGESQRILNEAECGIHINFESPHNLAKALERLQADPAACARMGKNGQTFVRERFNREKLAADMLAAIVQVHVSYFERRS